MEKHNKIFSIIMLKSLKICTSIVTIASCNNNIISNENFNSEKLKDIWEDIENIQHALKADIVNIEFDLKNEVYNYLERIRNGKVELNATCVNTLKGYSDQLKVSSQMANPLKTLSENIQQYIAQEIYDSTVQNNNEEINDNTNKTECCNSVKYTSPSAFKHIPQNCLSYDNKICTYRPNGVLENRQKQTEAKIRSENRTTFQECFLINELLKHGYVITIEKVYKKSKKLCIFFKLKSIKKDTLYYFREEECEYDVEKDFKNGTIPIAYNLKSKRRYCNRKLNNVMIYLLQIIGYNFSFKEEKLKSKNETFLNKYQANRIDKFIYNNNVYDAGYMYTVGKKLYFSIYDKVQKQDYEFTQPLLVD
jgi:hypothetical protein